MNGGPGQDQALRAFVEEILPRPVDQGGQAISGWPPYIIKWTGNTDPVRPRGRRWRRHEARGGGKTEREIHRRDGELRHGFLLRREV